MEHYDRSADDEDASAASSEAGQSRPQPSARVIGAQLVENLPFLPPPIQDVVPVSNLLLHPDYGRESKQSRLAYLRKRWSPAAVGSIAVSKRIDGTLMTIDGNHRVTLCREFGNPSSVFALVYIGLMHEEEALLYKVLNDTLSQSAVDLFRAELHYGDQTAGSIAQTVRDVGFEVALQASQNGGSIHCVHAMETVVRRYGIGHLYPTLRFLFQAFGGSTSAVRQYSVIGTAAFLKGYERQVDMEHLTEAVSHLGVSVMHGKANDVRIKRAVPMSTGYTHALVEAYNYNLQARNKLIAWGTDRPNRLGPGAATPRRGRPRREAAWNERIDEADSRPE